MVQKEEFAMFDDPNKELNRLQEELMAVESDDTLDGLDDLLKDYEPTNLEECFRKAFKDDEDFKRPDAPKNLTDAMSEMLLSEDEEVPAPEAKEKGIAGLVVLCALETAAIIGLLAWWFLCLR